MTPRPFARRKRSPEFPPMWTTELWPHGMMGYVSTWENEAEPMPQLTVLCGKHGARGVTPQGGCAACRKERQSGEYIEPCFPDNWEQYKRQAVPRG